MGRKDLRPECLESSKGLVRQGKGVRENRSIRKQGKINKKIKVGSSGSSLQRRDRGEVQGSVGHELQTYGEPGVGRNYESQNLQREDEKVLRDVLPVPDEKVIILEIVKAQIT